MIATNTINTARCGSRCIELRSRTQTLCNITTFLTITATSLTNIYHHHKAYMVLSSVAQLKVTSFSLMHPLVVPDEASKTW